MSLLIFHFAHTHAHTHKIHVLLFSGPEFEISGLIGEGSDSAAAGVDVVLFGEKSTASCSSTAGSSPELPAGFRPPSSVSSKKVICATKSDKNGQFKFSAVVCGDYIVVPFYRASSGSVYDVSPASSVVSVAGSNVAISERFIVRGFSVSGKVIVPGGASGVAGVTVRLGSSETVTDTAGVFKFDQVESGTYKMSVNKEKYTFSGPESIQISPTTSKLPDFIVKTVELCGRVSIPHPPAGVEATTAASRQVSLALASSPAKVLSQTHTLIDPIAGAYCFRVEPNQNYVVTPVVSDREKRAGLLLSSASQTVKIESEPFSGINFAQSLLTVSGRVRCLSAPCDPSIAVTLQSSGTEGADVVTTGLVADDVFVFQHVVPGAYVVSIDKPDWCFENQVLQVQVKQHDVTGLELVQTGYKLAVKSSHDVTVEYSYASESSSHSLALKARADSPICVINAGVYNVRVSQSCYSFSATNGKTVSENSFSFSTENKGKPLVLTAKSYRLNGVLELHAAVSDVTVEIRNSVDNSLVAVAPLKQVGKTEGGISRFAYSHWVDLSAGGVDAVEVKPISTNVFFYPKSIKSGSSGAECPPTLPAIVGRPGAFVQGQIQPATAGVKVTVSGGEDDIHETVSDAAGKYRVGPLPDTVEYSVFASAPGFYLKKEHQESSNKDVIIYNFRAMRLGSTLVSILNAADKTAVGGALISLSGGEGYRNNTVTSADGTIVFGGLFPGDYFAIPMLKEYSFAPAGGQAVVIEEGVEKKFEFRATRVAFSAFGAVRSLNGQGERAVIVEAVSEDTTDSVAQREEASTDEQGAFRLRGLVPGRSYSIRLKDSTTNDRIDHVVPTSASVTVSKTSPSDLVDVSFVAYRKPTRHSISGHIVFSNSSLTLEQQGEVLASITVVLIDAETPKEVVREAKLSRSLSAFDFTSLVPSKSSKWIIRLKSTLSSSLYAYKFDDSKVDISGSFLSVLLLLFRIGVYFRLLSRLSLLNAHRYVLAGVSTFVDVPIVVSVKQPGEETPPSSVASLVSMILLVAFAFYRKEVTSFVWKRVLQKEGEFAFGEAIENMFRSLQRWQQSRKSANASSGSNSSRK